MSDESFESISRPNPEHTQEYFNDLIERLKAKVDEIEAKMEKQFDHESAQFQDLTDSMLSEITILIEEGEKIDGTQFSNEEDYTQALDALIGTRDNLLEEKEKTSDLFAAEYKNDFPE